MAKLAGKTHKDRVAEFNNHLESLSEHHDIPKVCPGNLRKLRGLEQLYFKGRPRIRFFLVLIAAFWMPGTPQMSWFIRARNSRYNTVHYTVIYVLGCMFLCTIAGLPCAATVVIYLFEISSPSFFKSIGTESRPLNPCLLLVSPPPLALVA